VTGTIEVVAAVDVENLRKDMTLGVGERTQVTGIDKRRGDGGIKFRT